MTGRIRLYDWDRPLQAEALEISAGEGAMLTMRLALPGLQRAFTLLARVVRTVRGGLFKDPGFGICFIDIPAEARVAVHAYVAARRPRTA